MQIVTTSILTSMKLIYTYHISYILILKANNKTTKHYNRRSEIYPFTLLFHSCYIYISIKVEMAENNIKDIYIQFNLIFPFLLLRSCYLFNYYERYLKFL